MQMVAQNLLILRLTGSVALTGVSLAVQALPGLIFGLAGGALVDRWPRRLTAGLSQVALAGIAFTTAALGAFDLLNVVTLMILGLLTGLVATVDGPACALLGNDLVPRDDVPSAIAVGSVASNTGRLVGTAAGALVAGAGLPLSYAINGLSFLLVAASIPFLRLVTGSVTEPVEVSGGVRAGLSYLLNNRTMLVLAAIGALTSLLGRNYSLSMAALVTGPLGGSSTAYGVVSAALAVGGIGGSVVAGRLHRPRLRIVALLFTLAAGLQVMSGLSPFVLLLIALVIPMAASEAAAATATATMLQTVPPQFLRGRVLGAWRTMSTAWGLAGPPALGLLLETAGVRTGLVLGGTLVATVLALSMVVHRRRTAAAENSADSREPGFQLAA
jgi:MFS family permease